MNRRLNSPMAAWFCHSLLAQDRGLGEAFQWPVRAYLVCTSAVNNEFLEESGVVLSGHSHSLLCRSFSYTAQEVSPTYSKRRTTPIYHLKATQKSRHRRLLPHHGPPGRSLPAPGFLDNSAYIPTRAQGCQRTVHGQQNRDRAHSRNAEHIKGHRPSGTAREREWQLAELAVRECDSCTGCCRESALLRERGTFIILRRTKIH